MKFLQILCLVILPLLSFSCANKINKAVRDVKYSALETVGLEKRDLFKREIKNVKEEQEETGEAFRDALTRLKEVYAFDGGKLEKEYGKLKNSYDNASEEASELKERITTLDTVAGDLFTEWEQEITQINSSELKGKSQKQLKQTKAKYKELEDQLRKSEKKMDPILSKLNDQVLFLKHNLNAKAIAGLKTESGKIQSDIENLIKEVEESTKQAEALIETL